MTHAYGDCTGVRNFTCGLRVYYIPRAPFYNGTTFPTLIGNMGLLRVVLLRERITLVHAHQAFSTLALEAITHARCMRMKVSAACKLLRLMQACQSLLVQQHCPAACSGRAGACAATCCASLITAPAT